MYMYITRRYACMYVWICLSFYPSIYLSIYLSTIYMLYIYICIYIMNYVCNRCMCTYIYIHMCIYSAPMQGRPPTTGSPCEPSWWGCGAPRRACHRPGFGDPAQGVYFHRTIHPTTTTYPQTEVNGYAELPLLLSFWRLRGFGAFLDSCSIIVKNSVRSLGGHFHVSPM